MAEGQPTLRYPSQGGWCPWCGIDVLADQPTVHNGEVSRLQWLQWLQSELRCAIVMHIGGTAINQELDG